MLFDTLDHPMLQVSDSQRAGEAFEAMGFVVTPRSILPGMSNRLVCFPRDQAGRLNFIELMSLDDAKLVPPVMRDVLTGPGRIASMVLATPDIEAVHVTLTSRQWHVGPPMHFERDWVLPDGEVLRARFAVCAPQPGQSPIYWNVVQYKTPEHYARPEFTAQTNGAVGLVALQLVTPDPSVLAQQFATAWGVPLALRGKGADVPIGRIALRIDTPDFVERLLAMPQTQTATAAVAPVIAVDNLSVFADRLERADVPFIATASGLAARPKGLDGIAVLFEASHI